MLVSLWEGIILSLTGGRKECGPSPESRAQPGRGKEKKGVTLLPRTDMVGFVGAA